MVPPTWSDGQRTGTKGSSSRVLTPSSSTTQRWRNTRHRADGRRSQGVARKPTQLTGRGRTFGGNVDFCGGCSALGWSVVPGSRRRLALPRPCRHRAAAPGDPCPPERRPAGVSRTASVRTTRSCVRTATVSPACRTPRSRRTTRSGRPLGVERPPSGARTGAGRAPAGAGGWRGCRWDGPAASETTTVQCGWRLHHKQHRPNRQPRPPSGHRRAVAEVERHLVHHLGPPAQVGPSSQPLTGHHHPMPAAAPNVRETPAEAESSDSADPSHAGSCRPPGNRLLECLR